MSASTTPDSQPIQHVYRGHGGVVDRPLCCERPSGDRVRVPTIADLVPVTEIMSREITCARRDLGAEQLVELMVTNRIGCVPIVEDPGRPVGMVTKLDLVEQLVTTETKDAWPRTANELMMPLAITLGERATIAHAAAMMAIEDVHHIPIVDDSGRMIGIVSAMDVVRWLATNDGFGLAGKEP